MCSFTANAAFKRSLGFKGVLVSHGLRAIASTVLNEQGFNSLYIEASLAHKDQNTTRASYNRSDFFEQRKEIMC
ncbi:tyrosine-type recombinase/integrase [Vibrio owensii]|uniref:tyrosine-type recombinase/integrase n=1 Tax=Vibrio owensii TaxID=696485 RepID=UPI003AB098D8